eukprot:2546213-Pleurochrysis_carterae.AAC.1
MKLNHVVDQQYFDAKEKFKHAFFAAAYTRECAPLKLLYACLRVIAHDILRTMEGQPEDSILKCFGE